MYGSSGGAPGDVMMILDEASDGRVPTNMARSEARETFLSDHKKAAFPPCPILIQTCDIADSFQMSVASPHRDPSMGASEDYTAPSGDALNHSEMATSASPEEDAADPIPTTVEDATPKFTPAPGPPAPGSTKRTQSCEHCRKQKIRCIQDNLTEAGKCHR